MRDYYFDDFNIDTLIERGILDFEQNEIIFAQLEDFKNIDGICRNPTTIPESAYLMHSKQ